MGGTQEKEDQRKDKRSKKKMGDQGEKCAEGVGSGPGDEELLLTLP